MLAITDQKTANDFAVFERMKAEGVIENYDIFVKKVKNFSRENKAKVGGLELEMEEID